MKPAPLLPQAALLAQRYRAVMLGDRLTLLLLVGQAPLIGWLCGLVWTSVETDTPSLWFVLCLSAIWFGCINACREIVKERAIFERERFFGLRPSAYVLSKLGVLSALGLVQVVLLIGAVEWRIAMHGNLVLQILALLLASLCGTALGLLVSALSRHQERAVGAVPLLLLPQILFSEVAIPRNRFGEIVDLGEEIMPARWAFLVFSELAAVETDWLAVLLGYGVLAGATAGLLALTALLLQRRQEV
jgi:ABC transport system ATP-binding/permease protein